MGCGCGKKKAPAADRSVTAAASATYRVVVDGVTITERPVTLLEARALASARGGKIHPV